MTDPVRLVPVDLSDQVEHCYDIWEVRLVAGGEFTRTSVWHGHDYAVATDELQRRADAVLRETNTVRCLELTEKVTRLRRVALRVDDEAVIPAVERNFG